MAWTLRSQIKDCNAFINTINTLRIQNIFTDFTVKVADAKIECHRVILGASSAYFYAMFTSQMSEVTSGECSMKNIDKNVMELLVRYMYTGDVSIHHTDIHEYLHAADFLGLSELLNLFDTGLIEKVTSSNCIELFQLALQYKLETLLTFTRGFILTNLSTLQNCILEELKLNELNYLSTHQRIIRTSKIKSQITASSKSYLSVDVTRNSSCDSEAMVFDSNTKDMFLDNSHHNGIGTANDTSLEKLKERSHEVVFEVSTIINSFHILYVFFILKYIYKI